jgi:hydrogenase maturation protease
MSTATEHVLVLGVGNLLWADEGFGVRCVEELSARYDWPEQVEIVDGGTQGLALIPYLQRASRVVLLDALDFGLEPGTLIQVPGERVPHYLAARKTSLHQTGMSEVFACADLLGATPRELVLIGVQPVVLEDYGGSLSPLVAQRVPVAIRLTLHQLARWGIVPRRKPQVAQSVLPNAVARTPYELDRPAAEAACRTGDARVLARSHAPAQDRDHLTAPLWESRP